MKIGVDLDGVVVDFSAGWRQAYHQWFGVLLPEDGQWHSIVNQTHFEDEPAFWAWVDACPTFWTTMPAIPGALGALYDFERAGHELVFVTNRKPVARLATEDWLYSHGVLRYDDDADLAAPPPNLHMVRRKADVEWDVLIEDSPRNLAEVTAAGRTAIRFVYPYNKGAPGFAAHGWPEVRRLVEHMADVFV